MTVKAQGQIALWLISPGSAIKGNEFDKNTRNTSVMLRGKLNLTLQE